MTIKSASPKKKRKSQKRILSSRRCPKCGKPLILRVNASTHERFWGCTGYRTSSCAYAEPIRESTIVDYIAKDLKIVNWKYDFDKEVVSMLEQNNVFNKRRNLFQSSYEKKYLIGAIYYLDQRMRARTGGALGVHRTIVEYNGIDYESIGLEEPWPAWEGSGPSAVAFVPQLKFGEKLHHDLGIFYSNEHGAVLGDMHKNTWWLKCAIEVDIHPSHNWGTFDKFRDSLVSYPIYRLRWETDSPITWFEKIINRDYADTVNTFSDTPT